MKRILISLSLFAAACSGSLPTSPSGSTSGSQTTQTSAEPVAGSVAGTPTVEPAPGGPTANAPVPQFTLSGPRDPLNCFTAGTSPMQWVLNVTDAGPSALRFVALAHQDDTPGCGATVKNPRSRLDISGVTAHTPHSSGQTIFAFNPKMYSCGRVQVDVSIFDAAGNEILIVGVVINYGTQCTPPPSSLTCVPPSQTVLIGQPANLSATGGTGTYSWSTPNGAPASGNGAAFTTTYASAGTYVATVTSGSATATCQVNVPPSITTELTCTPATQTTAIGQAASLTAVGGTGTYGWSAPGGSTASGTGSSFTTSYAAAGTNNVTVTSGGATKTCQVVVPPPPPAQLVCAAPTQSVAINATATVTATGGTGAYGWSAPGGLTVAGSGPSFNTTYPSAGTRTITVTSGAQNATCQVVVPPPPPPTLVCTPPSQTVPIGQTATVGASGGTGAYTWSAPGGSTPTGSGASFSTTYGSAGSNTITVTSGAQTANCTVLVPSPPALSCSPSTQTVAPGATASLSASGGSGGYVWEAPNSATPSGTGPSFSTVYLVPATNTITLTSGSSSVACAVVVQCPPIAAAGPMTDRSAPMLVSLCLP